MSEAKVGEWVHSKSGWTRSIGTVVCVVLLEHDGWAVWGLTGPRLAHGPETGDLGRAHADAALCEHGLTPWPCAACGGEAPLHTEIVLLRPYCNAPHIPLCEACGRRVEAEYDTVLGMTQARWSTYDHTPLGDAWLRALDRARDAANAARLAFEREAATGPVPSSLTDCPGSAPTDAPALGILSEQQPTPPPDAQREPVAGWLCDGWKSYSLGDVEVFRYWSVWWYRMGARVRVGPHPDRRTAMLAAEDATAEMLRARAEALGYRMVKP